MKLENKLILITGASTGIGKALAEELAHGGNKLILLARRYSLLEELKLSLSSRGGVISIKQCDVADEAESTRVYGEILEETGVPDVAILNAGVAFRQDVLEAPQADIDSVFQCNVMGLIHAMRVLVPAMKKRGSGIIAGVSSLADGRGYPKSGVYCASKAAASILLESIRTELRGSGVAVLTVKPGFVKTPMTDPNNFKMPFLMQPADAARCIIRGIEKRKPVIRFPFRLSLMTRIGNRLPVWLFDRLIGRMK